jgi:hypothetical protein
MSIFGAAKKTNSTVDTKLIGYRVQTSLYGAALPFGYGQTRLSGNVVWTGDWQAIPVVTGGKKGGTGGKAKGGGGTNQQYTYKTALMIGLCQGVIVGIRNIWYNRTKLSIATSTEIYTIIGGGGLIYHPHNETNLVMDHGVGYGSVYSTPVNDFGSPGSTTLTGTQTIPFSAVTGVPTTGQYRLNSDGSYTFAAADVGKTVSMLYSWTIPNTDGTLNDPLGLLQLSLFNGGLAQTAWPYLTTHHPEQAIGYSEMAYVAGEAFDLGSSGAISNLSMEIAFPFRFGGGIVDAEVSVQVVDILTNTAYGAGFPAAYIGSVTNMANYCKANGLFVSMLVDSQRDAASWIGDLLTIANTAAVYSEGLLKFRPYGDTSAIGYGAQFTPDTQPIYDLGDDDFLHADDADPVICVRPSVRDAFNQKSVEWLNRGNGYNAETLDEKDDRMIALYGLRPDSPLQLHAITTHDVAVKVCNTELARSVNIRAQYQFKLGWQYLLLEPMDLVRINDPYIGLSNFPVRIISIDEDENGDLSILAEEFPWGTAGPTLHPKQTTTSFGPGFFSDPGMTNTPTFFEPPDQMTKDQGFALWIGLSGPANWGGASVYMSTDNATYDNIGVQNGPSAMGLLTAALGANPDPDTTHTLSVDMTMSGVALTSYTQAQADAFLPGTLILVDGEIIAYKTATLTAPDKYDITYLRRGVFGTPIGAHVIGSTFCVLDDAMFEYKFDVADIGQTRWFKFASFNDVGAQQQDLAALTAIAYDLTNPNPRYISYPPTNWTQLPGDSLVLADASGGAIIYTLLKAAIEVGDRITIQKTDNSGFTVTIQAAVGDTIDQPGVTSVVLTDPLQVVEILSQG